MLRSSWSYLVHHDICDPDTLSPNGNLRNNLQCTPAYQKLWQFEITMRQLVHGCGMGMVPYLTRRFGPSKCERFGRMKPSLKKQYRRRDLIFNNVALFIRDHKKYGSLYHMHYATRLFDASIRNNSIQKCKSCLCKSMIFWSARSSLVYSCA